MADLEHLALIWVGVLVAVMAARLTRLTPVVYYLGVGAVLVQLGWLPRESSPFIRGLSELGIVLIMFALGFEESAGRFLRSIRHSWGIALFGALAPFAVAYSVGRYFWGDHAVAMMCGLAMTATAVSLTMASLRSEGLQSSTVATRIMTSAVLDDVASLALVAIVVPVLTSDAPLELSGVGVVLLKATLFFLLVSACGAWVFPHETRGWIGKVPLLGRIGVRDLLSFGGGEHAVLLALLVAIISALVGHAFGFHPAVGAYLAGLILAKEYFSPGSEIGSFSDTRRILDNIAFSWIGPVFFVSLGCQLDIDLEKFLGVAPQVATLTLGVMVSQIVSASLAARYTGGLDGASSFMIGLGMLGRAELAFVVMDIAYVQHAILTEEAFTTLMATCFFLNIAVPLSIHAWKPFHERSEQRRAAKAEQA